MEMSSYYQKPGQHIQYNKWLWDGRQTGLSSRLGRVNGFLFHMLFILVLGHIQPPFQWVERALSHYNKAARE
jgi:hypothetical protein